MLFSIGVYVRISKRFKPPVCSVFAHGGHPPGEYGAFIEVPLPSLQRRLVQKAAHVWEDSAVRPCEIFVTDRAVSHSGEGEGWREQHAVQAAARQQKKKNRVNVRREVQGSRRDKRRLVRSRFLLEPTLAYIGSPATNTRSPDKHLHHYVASLPPPYCHSCHLV